MNPSLIIFHPNAERKWNLWKKYSTDMCGMPPQSCGILTKQTVIDRKSIAEAGDAVYEQTVSEEAESFGRMIFVMMCWNTGTGSSLSK